MTNDDSLNQASDECLESVLDIVKIAKKFRDENLALPIENSHTLAKLESLVFKCLDSSWKIDSILEDGELSPFEFDQLSLHVNQIEQDINILATTHKENLDVLNKIINIYNLAEGLVEEAYYTKEISSFKSIQSRVKEKLYSVNETAFHNAVNGLNQLLQVKKHIELNNQQSKLEREIICLAKILGTMENKVMCNVLYTELVLILKAYRTSIEVIEATILPMYQLIKESYFLDKIQSAKEGLAKIAETEDFDIGDTISIKGLFRRKGGINEIQELSGILKNFS